MTEAEFTEQLEANPFVPFRVQLVSGKSVDVLAPHAAWTLNHLLLIFRNPVAARNRAEGYDVISYANIERIEQLSIGNRPSGKRRPA